MSLLLLPRRSTPTSSASLITNDPLQLPRAIGNAPKQPTADDPFDFLPPLSASIPAGGTITAPADVDVDDEKRLEWLRSNIIGAEAEFQSPFGRRRITYCDLTASGRSLKVIEDYIRNRVLPLYGNTHTGDSHVGLHTTELVHSASRYVKRCLGGGPHDILLFCGSGCTAAIKRLQEVTGMTVPPILRSRMLACIPKSERWVVFLGPYEHHSNLLMWRQSLAEVVEVGLDAATGQINIEALRSALSAPQYAGRPKLGSFSACSNVTGLRTDTRAIARLLHRYGAYACFDFACSGPYVDIDIGATTPAVAGCDDDDDGVDDRYDAVFLSPHKFLGGPGTPGILLMNDELYLLKRTPPSTSGGGTVLFVNWAEEDTLYCDHLEEREDAGTPAIVQKIRAALAFRVKEHMMANRLVSRREEELTHKVLARLSANTKIDVLGFIYNDPLDHRNQPQRLPIVPLLIYPTAEHRADWTTGQHAHLHCRFVTKLLNDLFGVQARGGCVCSGPYSHHLLRICPDKSKAIRSAIQSGGYVGIRPGFTRVTFPYYATHQEIDFVLDAIEFIATYGPRFLHLYSFDWKTGDWTCLDTFTTSETVAAAGAHVYEEYMGAATLVAESLPPYCPQTSDRGVPFGLDPDLITFMI